MSVQNYQKSGRLHDNDSITSAEVPDPENIPQPLGWTLKVRPYKIESKTRSGIILAGEGLDFMNTVTNIGRVVAIGPCCWNRPHHMGKDGEQFDWVEIGDFVSFPKNTGVTRHFKGVSIVTLSDDEIDERLLDPLVFGEDNMYSIDIPKEQLEKYNTVYNKDFMKGKK